MSSVNPVGTPVFTLKIQLKGIGGFFDELLKSFLLLAVHQSLIKGCRYKLKNCEN